IWNNLLVCAYCTSSAPAQRSYSSKVYVMETASAFGLTADPGVTTYVRVYIQDNIVVFGVSGSEANVQATITGPHTRINYNVTAYPAGTIHLGMATWSIGYWQGGYWSSVTNDRPQEFQ